VFLAVQESLLDALHFAFSWLAEVGWLQEWLVPPDLVLMAANIRTLPEKVFHKKSFSWLESLLVLLEQRAESCLVEQWTESSQVEQRAESCQVEQRAESCQVGLSVEACQAEQEAETCQVEREADSCQVDLEAETYQEAVEQMVAA